MSLSRNEAEEILSALRKKVAGKDICWTCDCLQGLLVQLKMDSDEDISDLVDPLTEEKEKLHGCLGCEPCYGGEAFSDYIRRSL